MNKILFKIWKAVISGVVVILSTFVVSLHLMWAWAWVYNDPEIFPTKKDRFFKYPASTLLFCCPTDIGVRFVNDDGAAVSGIDLKYEASGLSDPGSFNPPSFDKKSVNSTQTVKSNSKGVATVRYYAGDVAGDVTITATEISSSSNPSLGSRTVTVKGGSPSCPSTSTLHDALVTGNLIATVRCNGEDGVAYDAITVNDVNLEVDINKAKPE